MNTEQEASMGIPITMELSRIDALELVRRNGGYESGIGWCFDRGSAGLVGPFPMLEEAVQVAILNLAAGGEVE